MSSHWRKLTLSARDGHYSIHVNIHIFNIDSVLFTSVRMFLLLSRNAVWHICCDDWYWLITECWLAECLMCLIFDRNELLNEDCGIIDYGVQLQLRLCLSETSCEQSDAFPSSVSLSVNGVTCPLQVLTWWMKVVGLHETHIQGGAKKTPRPNCVEIGELLQYHMLNTVINFFCLKISSRCGAT